MDFLDKCDDKMRQADNLVKLKQRKAELTAKLNKLRMENAMLQQEAAVDDQSVDAMELFKTQQMLNAYRLFGISILQDSSSVSAVTLRFDALYQSQYPSDEFYTVQLIKQGGNYMLGQHSLPPFVPVKTFAEEYLETGDIKLFVDQVWNHVYNFVQRREGTRHVKVDLKDYLDGEVEVNLPVTFVKFCLTVRETVPKLEVTLQYKLDAVLPDTAHIVAVSNEMEEDNKDDTVSKKKLDKIVKKGEELLKCNQLHSAVTSLVKLFEKL